METILDLPDFLKEIREHLEDPNFDIDNMQMGCIMSWMMEEVPAEEVAKRLENR